MDAPVQHMNLFNAMLALYLIGYQITICVDWIGFQWIKRIINFHIKINGVELL